MHRNRILALCLVALMSQAGCQGEPDPADPRKPSTKPGDSFDPGPYTAAAGGADGEGPSGAAGATSDDSDTTEQPSIPGGHYCVISADCGHGEFCDLGECINVCESDADCEGDQECSERGRCIEAGSEDRDPAPVTEKVGPVTVNPTSVKLTEDDSKLVLTLHNQSDAPLAYRVELMGPHLSIDEPRGEIDEDGILSIDVDPEGLAGLETFGTVHIYTELGNLVVDAPIRVGMTDTYQGVLRYGSGAVPFGNASMFLELQEHNGDVEVRVDPKRSLLFPESQGTAGGRGIYTVSDGLEFTITQRIDAAAGGDANHLARPIGRSLSFALDRTAEGNFQGDFEERIYGLLESPVTLHGTAFFSRAGTEPTTSFELGELDDMPSLSAAYLPDPNAAFGWSWKACELDARQAAGCSAADINLASCIASTLEQAYYEPMFDALQVYLANASPLSNLRDTCEEEMFSTSALGTRSSCAVIPPLACALRSLVNVASPSAELVPETFSRLYARSLAPALLVAQDHIVEGFRASLVQGRSVQVEHYEKARAALNGPLKWLLNPALLEFLRRMPVDRVSGDASAEDPTARNYPAVRALSQALWVMALLDAERNQLESSKELVSKEEHELQLDAAQVSALLSFLNSTAVAAVLDSWGSPAGVGGEISGFLSELDRGFLSLSQGALSFGVPDGEISFVFDPQRPQPTNFEQVLLLHAGPQLAQFRSDELAFLDAKRSFEQNQDSLRRELEQVRNSQDEALASICGSDFDPDDIESDEDWADCGADGTGQIAELSLDIEQAHLRMQAAEGRVLSANRKVDIDVQALADTQNVHKDNLNFLDREGEELKRLTIQEGVLNAVQSALTVSANAELWNGGAPAAMAGVVALIEGRRAKINEARQRLQTAKEMHFEEAGARIELINGMANIQRQLIDVTQLELEIAQDALAITQADVRRTNALDTARRVHLERKRTLARISESSATDPLDRILQDHLALSALRSRATAQRWLYRAGRALEYEVNTPLGDSLGRAVLGAFNSQEVDRLSACYQSIFSEYTSAFGVPQEFSTEVSLRETLGVTGPRTDKVTGEELSEAELFRRILLTNQTLESDGSVRIQFSTNLMPNNGLWSSNVCDDKISSVKAQLIGDFQGDSEANIEILVEGASVMRRCDSEEVVGWDVKSSSKAVIQAGVNDFGPTANTSLFGQSVARASWTLIIPSGATAPSNRDLNLEHLEDIVLEVSHRALPRLESSAGIDISCLGNVGAGG